jgi:DTW domain-containing protein
VLLPEGSPGRHRRAYCPTCARPQRACFCHWIVPVANEVDVLVLQHPAEVHHAKGSARLLQLSLGRCRLAVGETFAEPALRSLVLGLSLREPHSTHPERPQHTILLYPSPARLPAIGSISTETFETPHRLRLVVLDATWRKSRTMLHANPLLQGLPRLALEPARPSAYLVRKAHRSFQLSTLEATCRALMQLERDEARYQTLLAGFDGFVGQQMAFRHLGKI